MFLLKRLAFSVGATAVAVLAYALCVAPSPPRVDGDHTLVWNIYQGGFATASSNYVVEIDESDRGAGFRRMVHLKATKEHFDGITGHDYNDDGRWDRIFYCGRSEMTGTKSFGCNSVIRTSAGWKFEPCERDKGIIHSFSQHAIAFAESELDAAMAKLHKDTHVVQRWRWDEKTQRLVRTFPPTSKT